MRGFGEVQTGKRWIERIQRDAGRKAIDQKDSDGHAGRKVMDREDLEGYRQESDRSKGFRGTCR